MPRTKTTSRRLRLLAPLLCLGALALAGCGDDQTSPTPSKPDDDTVATGGPALIPLPASQELTQEAFTLTAATRIGVESAAAEDQALGDYLARRLRPATGYALPVGVGGPGAGTIALTTEGGDPSLGEEGYELRVTPDAVSLVAYRPAGVFRGIQTLRQLLPAAIESASVQPGPWQIPLGTIRDAPRFAWRGVMLDVARHFFGVADVKRFIDLAAYYKLNRFHLHLTDDQGWRIMIESWPRLASYGGSTAVGGGPGGYYTRQQYAEIVAYAKSRYMVVVPEIDMPGHTNAALASYAELNCDGVAPPLYTGIAVGFSSLCTTKAITYTFVDDVIREVAALTDGPYLHVGGDETSAGVGDYEGFIARVQEMVRAHGKRMVGWEDVARARLLGTSLAQHWHDAGLAAAAAAQGVPVVMSPASRAYLDMMYDASTPLGQNWAGYISVQQAYTWDPVTQVAGLAEAGVAGVEAPLWTETLRTMADLEYMAFPRLPGYAELGWSPAAGRSWSEYRQRLAAHGPRLTAMGVHFYGAPDVPWR